MPRDIKTLEEDVQLDPMNSFGYLTRVTFRNYSRLLERLTLPFGVSAGQWRLLRVLWEKDNITQRVLSDRAGTGEANTVHIVRSLVNDGLAKRTRCTEDKRKYYITLTPKARRLRTKLMPMVVKVNDMALEGIDPGEVEIARKVLMASFENLSRHLGVPNE